MENKFKYNGKELQHQEFSDGSGLKGIKQYLNENPDLAKDVRVSRVVDLDPFEASQIDMDDGAEKHQQFLHVGTIGNERKKGMTPEKSGRKKHALMSFYDEIQTIFDAISPEKKR